MYRGKTFYESAKKYNSRHPNGIIMYFSSYPSDSKEFAKDVSDFQKKHDDLEMDGKLGPRTLSRIRQDLFDKTEGVELTESDYMKIARITSRFEGTFWACNRDGEFKGKFDRPGKPHWASGKVHIGLSFGYIQFTQDSGNLGKLLMLMHEKDPSQFATIFGPHSDELLEVTNRSGRFRKAGRSPRVQPVGGHDLWGDYWVERFRKAGRYRPFQDCQIQLALKEFMVPAIKTANELDIKSERGLAVVFDRSVHFGARGARKLLEKHRGSDPEHLFLGRLVTEWKKHRWHHRLLKIYYEMGLLDSSCVFT